MIVIKKTPQEKKYISCFTLEGPDEEHLQRYSTEVNMTCWEEHSQFVTTSETKRFGQSYRKNITFNENVRPLDAMFLLERIKKQIITETYGMIEINVIDSHLIPYSDILENVAVEFDVEN